MLPDKNVRGGTGTPAPAAPGIDQGADTARKRAEVTDAFPPWGGEGGAGGGGSPCSNHGDKVPHGVLSEVSFPPLPDAGGGHGGRLGRVLDMAVREPETGARLVASVDWISCTLPEVEGWRELVDRVVLGICDVREPFVEAERGMLGYERSGRYGPVIVAWGGASQRNTVYLSIPGVVAGALSADKLAQVAVLLESFGARLTRVDCAIDDYEGRYLTIERMREWYAEGKFTGQGRPPKAVFISDEGNRTGCTFYVGSRGAGKILRCYEKGRQLGDPSSPWVRVEMQLGNKLRELPWEILSRPADMIAGAYPALRAVGQCPLTVNAYYVKLLAGTTVPQAGGVQVASAWSSADPEPILHEGHLSLLHSAVGRRRA